MTEIKPGTPPPWQTAEWAEGCCFDIESVAGQYIGSASFEPDDASMPSHAEAKANARYIVHTANAHPSLIAGLREAREAIWAILCGGNHLALLIGAGHPPHTASTDDALDHYGATDAYDIWCCWREIMKARDTLTNLDTLLSQEGGK